jgi:hypothetical protein
MENENTGRKKWQAEWKTRKQAVRNARKNGKRETGRKELQAERKTRTHAERNCRQNVKRVHRQKEMAGRMENEKTDSKEW